MQKTHHGRGASEEVILVAVPVQHKRLVEPIEAMIRATERACASGRGGRAIDYAEVETTMAERTAELERAAHAEVLAALDIDSPRIVVCGKTYTRIIASSPGTYYTMAGPVEVKRALYREDGVRNGPSVDTISLRAGTYGRGWLPQTAQAIAHEVQRGPSRDAAASARQSGRLPYCRAVFETVAHEVGTAWDRVHAGIEDSLIDEMEIPDETYSVSRSALRSTGRRCRWRSPPADPSDVHGKRPTVPRGKPARTPAWADDGGAGWRYARASSRRDAETSSGAGGAQLAGNSSSMRLAGCVARRVSTSAK